MHLPTRERAVIGDILAGHHCTLCTMIHPSPYLTVQSTRRRRPTHREQWHRISPPLCPIKHTSVPGHFLAVPAVPPLTSSSSVVLYTSGHLHS